jgi:hypothetical protein
MLPQQPDPARLQLLLNEIHEWEVRNVEPYDKAILTLSSGALALSLTFTKDLVPPEVAQATIILYLAWGLFVLSLGTNIYAFINTLRTFPKQRVFAEAVFKDCTKTPEDFKVYMKHLHTVIERFNTYQGIFFLCGMLAFTTYVIINYEARTRAAHHAQASIATTAKPPVPTAAPVSSPPTKKPAN